MTGGCDEKIKTVHEMLGEFFREAGVLVGVFGMLDLAAKNKEAQACEKVVLIVVVAIVCVSLTGIGFYIERRRAV